MRSAERLWGLDARELREIQHVYIGNAFFAGGSGYVSGSSLDGRFGLLLSIRPNLLGILLLPLCLLF